MLYIKDVAVHFRFMYVFLKRSSHLSVIVFHLQFGTCAPASWNSAVDAVSLLSSFHFFVTVRSSHFACRLCLISTQCYAFKFCVCMRNQWRVIGASCRLTAGAVTLVHQLIHLYQMLLASLIVEYETLRQCPLWCEKTPIWWSNLMDFRKEVWASLSYELYMSPIHGCTDFWREHSLQQIQVWQAGSWLCLASGCWHGSACDVGPWHIPNRRFFGWSLTLTG